MLDENILDTLLHRFMVEPPLGLSRCKLDPVPDVNKNLGCQV